MNQIEALRRLDDLGVEAISTRDAAAVLGVTPANATMILGRLARAGRLLKLARGRWVLGRASQSLMVAEHVAAPDPAYVSLHSALFHHGLIEQIPAVRYAVTTGRTRRIRTPSGTVSLHRVPPELFTGFEVEPGGAQLAVPEKALFDCFYLGPTKSRLFANLPEIEIPASFRWSAMRPWLAQVRLPARRTYIEGRITALKTLKGLDN